MQGSLGQRHREPDHHQQKVLMTPHAHLDASLPTAPPKLPYSRCKAKLQLGTGTLTPTLTARTKLPALVTSD